jgi:hypothetical protein
VKSLPPEMTAAIHAHVEQHNLGGILSLVTDCIETTSTRSKKEFFGGGGQVVITGVLLTPVLLLWAIRGDSPEVAVISARLADIVVEDYTATQFAKMVPDIGVEVSGSFTDVAEKGSAFIGLDEGRVAQRFKEALFQAVQRAKK